MPVVRRIAATTAVLREWRGQPDIAYLPPEELARRRDARVRAIVEHAVATVPFYRSLGTRAGDIVDAAALEGLPLLGKHLLQENATAFRSTEIADDDVVVLRSSGTTGLPVAVAHDRPSALRTIAWSRRETAVLREYGVREYGGAAVSIDNRTSTFRNVNGFFAGSVWRPGRPRRSFVAADAPLADAIRVIEDVRPDVVGGYGSYLELLFRTVIAEGGLEHRPKVIRYAADTFTAEGRRLVEKELGIPVLSLYHPVEALRVGFTCGRGDGFHLHEDLVHVTVVDRDGRPLPEGETGELVLSNLVNRATVLLNYRIGDTGRIDRSTCPCGRTFARIVEFAGRVSQPITLPDGNVVFTVTVQGAIKRPEIVRFRLVEDRPNVFRLILRTVGEVDADEVAADVGVRVGDVLRGADLTVSFDPTLGDGEGKFRPYELLSA